MGTFSSRWWGGRSYRFTCLLTLAFCLLAISTKCQDIQVQVQNNFGRLFTNQPSANYFATQRIYVMSVPNPNQSIMVSIFPLSNSGQVAEVTVSTFCSFDSGVIDYSNNKAEWISAAFNSTASTQTNIPPASVTPSANVPVIFSTGPLGCARFAFQIVQVSSTGTGNISGTVTFVSNGPMVGISGGTTQALVGSAAISTPIPGSSITNPTPIVVAGQENSSTYFPLQLDPSKLLEINCESGCGATYGNQATSSVQSFNSSYPQQNGGNAYPVAVVDNFYERYKAINTSTATNIGGKGAATVHTITVGSPGTSWEVQLWDASSCSGSPSGTEILDFFPTAPVTLTLDVAMSAGNDPCVVTIGSTPGWVTVSSN
jgi:hypothetical protein